MTITTILLALALIGSFAVLVWTNRQHTQRIDRLIGTLLTERASSDHRIHQLITHHAAEREKANPDTTALIALVERMAQRLQAPQAAVVEHQMAQPLPESPQAIPFENDAAYWAAQEPMSKEALADALMDAETAHG